MTSTISAIPVIDPALKKKQEAQNKALLLKRVEYTDDLKAAVVTKVADLARWVGAFEKANKEQFMGIVANEKNDVKLSFITGRGEYNEKTGGRHKYANPGVYSYYYSGGSFVPDLESSSVSVESIGKKVMLCGEMRNVEIDKESRYSRMCANPRGTKFAMVKETKKPSKYGSDYEYDIVEVMEGKPPAKIPEMLSCVISLKGCALKKPYEFDKAEKFLEKANAFLDRVPDIVRVDRERREKELSEKVMKAEEYEKKKGAVKKNILFS